MFLTWYHARKKKVSSHSKLRKTALLDKSESEFSIKGAANRGGKIDYWKSNKEKIDVVYSFTHHHFLDERDT